MQKKKIDKFDIKDVASCWWPSWQISFPHFHEETVAGKKQQQQQHRFECLILLQHAIDI